ncbi:NAD-dependent epimerase [Sediminitomix flava]|uniref:UDP-glucuronate 4-epimerase n=1 Tax=Sediminitomix flava TaxID=379075 RepID=A0A315Z7N8_SEDFL|nr:NAD-dependent epimerase [Sediminitomix flava]PWJ40941.1 UDP-glucuronate 4-epimerase [Sediminitomix flava]
MKGSSVLVTGAAGFIGFHLVEALVGEGYRVVGIDNINDYYDVNLKYARLAKSGIDKVSIESRGLVKSSKHSNYQFQKLDLVDLQALENLFVKEEFDYVVNLAAQAGVRYSLDNPHAYVQSNIVGFVNILECCRHNNIKHFVYASSSSVYGANDKIPFSEEDRVDNPVSLYAATKKSNELMAYTYSHLYNVPTSGLRFFTVYGPWGRPDMAPMLFADAMVNGREIKVFNHGEMQRDFTYIDDVVIGIIGSLEKIPTNESKAEVYNIGNSTPIKLMDFITNMEETLGVEAKKMYMEMQAGDVKVTYADTAKLKNNTGYSPSTPLKEGVKEFIKWYTEFYIN